MGHGEPSGALAVDGGRSAATPGPDHVRRWLRSHLVDTAVWLRDELHHVEQRGHGPRADRLRQVLAEVEQLA